MARFRRHCSDDQLLALADGELDGRQAAEVERHLESCWSCRGRKQEMELAAQRLARMVDTSGYPGAGWLDAARARLDTSIASRETESTAGTKRAGWWRWVLVPAACAAAAGSVFVATRQPSRPQRLPVPRTAAPVRTATAHHGDTPPPSTAPAFPNPSPLSSDLRAKLNPRRPGRDPVAEQIEADYALHRAGACVAESLEATVTADGEVAVRGVVESGARRTELAASLAQVPNVRFEVQAADEAALPAAALPAPASTVRPFELPLRKALEEHFRAAPDPARAIADFAGGAAEIASAIYSESWALRRLGEKYPSERTHDLHGPARWLLEDMIREHGAGIRQRSARFRERLSPVFGGAGPDGPAARAEWPDSLARLTEAAEEMDALARGLFAGGTLDRDPAAAVRLLVARASWMEAAASELELTAHGALRRRDARANNRISKE